MIRFLVCGLLTAALSIASFAAQAHDPKLGMKAETLVAALKNLGHEVNQHKDADGRPHLMFRLKVPGVQDIAVFFADCTGSECEDITYYADFGDLRGLTMKQVNEWNHINSRMRSKAFISENADGSKQVGLSMTVSFLDDTQGHAAAWNAGMFLVEARIFAESFAK